MNGKSKLPILSFLLGCLGAWCAFKQAGAPQLIAIALGIGAVTSGVIAMASLRRAGPGARGRGLAISAVFLGVAAIVVSALILISFVIRQLPMQGRRQGWDEGWRGIEVLAGERMGGKSAEDFSSNLPIAILETDGQPLSKGRSRVIRARFYDVQNGRASVSSKPAYDGLGTIHLRGYSTLHLPKPSYTFHTVDAETNQVKVPLLGLPAEADWVLYAPFEDKTLLRDVLAYELANRMGHYAPRTRFIELFVRTSDRRLSMRDYAGVYVLVEKIKRGRDRVNIAKLGPNDLSEPDISGGYIVKRDHGEGGDSRFRTPRGGPYTLVYPKPGAITTEQKRWIRRYFTEFESNLYGPDFSDRENGYAAYLDVDSFIDAHWLIELSKNVDGFRYSAFITKDRGGKLKLEPPWDWNRSFGNANYYGGGQPKGWYSSNLRPNEINWYHRLREDPEFARRCKDRWFQLRKEVFDPKRINRRIDELAAQLKESQERNFRRWPVMGQQVTCNYYVGNSFDDEVRWMKKWVERRIAWIDGQLGTPRNL